MNKYNELVKEIKRKRTYIEFIGFFMEEPTKIRVGSKIGTKYGDIGLVKSIDFENRKFLLDNGECFKVDRISIVYEY